MKIRLFPGIIFVLLGINLCVVVITVYLAHTDRSFAVVPDYYGKALAWNEVAAQRERNRELGWTANIEVGGVGVSGRTVAVRLQDREGDPITGADVEILAFHNARASAQYRTTLDDAGDGVYRAVMPLHDAGVWEFRVRARTEEGTLTSSASVAVAGAAQGAGR